MTRFSELYQLVPVFFDTDISDGTTGDPINTSRAHSVCFVLMSSDTDWSSGTPAITVKSATTAAGASSGTAVKYFYRKGSAAVGSNSADILSAWASGSAETLAATDEGKMVVVELKMSDVTDGHDWLCIAIDNAAAGAGEMACLAIIKPRYAQDAIPTALE
jgi:hypothetical protein